MFLFYLTDEGSAPELLYMDGKQWPNEGHGNIILRVFFTQQPPSETNEDKILNVMREWSKHCGVKFERAEYPDQSEIRISFEKGLFNVTHRVSNCTIICHNGGEVQYRLPIIYHAGELVMIGVLKSCDKDRLLIHSLIKSRTG